METMEEVNKQCKECKRFLDNDKDMSRQRNGCCSRCIIRMKNLWQWDLTGEFPNYENDYEECDEKIRDMCINLEGQIGINDANKMLELIEELPKDYYNIVKYVFDGDSNTQQEFAELLKLTEKKEGSIKECVELIEDNCIKYKHMVLGLFRLYKDYSYCREMLMKKFVFYDDGESFNREIKREMGFVFNG